MSQIIGIIDYGISGNIYNIKKALEHCKKDIGITIISSKAQLKKIDKIILPGVGAYPDAMRAVSGYKDELCAAIRNKFTLGICLGMQILSEQGYEFQKTSGLALFEGEVMRLAVECRIPHIGWEGIDQIKECPLLKGISRDEQFYFMHSYEFINYKNVIALSAYSGHRFVSVIEKENIFGVQFHPEKSRLAGLKVFENFLSL